MAARWMSCLGRREQLRGSEWDSETCKLFLYPQVAIVPVETVGRELPATRTQWKFGVRLEDVHTVANRLVAVRVAVRDRAGTGEVNRVDVTPAVLAFDFG